MDSEKIFKLIDAGFTAEEIRKMEPQETGQSDQAGTNETPAEEKGQESAANEGAVGSEVFAQLSKTVADLTKTVQEMQNNNINSAEGGKQSPVDKVQETINSFIKEL